MAEITSESVADLIPESVADFARKNTRGFNEVPRGDHGFGTVRDVVEAGLNEAALGGTAYGN